MFIYLGKILSALTLLKFIFGSSLFMICNSHSNFFLINASCMFGLLILSKISDFNDLRKKTGDFIALILAINLTSSSSIEGLFINSNIIAASGFSLVNAAINAAVVSAG